MKDQIEVGLRELRPSVKRMKELLESQKLREQEERGRRTPPSFRLRDDTEREIKTEEGFSWWTPMNIKTLLVSRAGPIAQKQKRPVAKLEELEVQRGAAPLWAEGDNPLPGRVHHLDR